MHETIPANKEDIPTGLSFDDVLIIPQFSEITSRSQVSTRTRLAGEIELGLPIISSNMDTVTMAEMAIAMAKIGAIGFIHRFLSIEKECRQVEKVKRYRSHVIANPYSINYRKTLGEAIEIMEEHEIGGLMVTTDDGRLTGLITWRDAFSEESSRVIEEIMTPRADLVVGTPETTPDEALKLMHARRVEKLPLVDENERVTGLIVVKDIRKLEDNPNSTLDGEGRLMVGASVGVVNEYIERSEALLEVGTDILVVDVAHGHAAHVGAAVKELRRRFKDTPIIAGDVATAEGVRYLHENGADAVRVGIGPGCFAAGTRVLMANGSYKNIEDVTAGERVINMHGRAVNVVGARCTGEREVMSYRHVGFYEDTVATPDHLHYVGDLSTCSPMVLASSGYHEVLTTASEPSGGPSKIGWKALGDIERATFLAPRELDLELPAHFAIDLADFSERGPYLRRYTPTISDNYDLGYVFGFFLGDSNSHLSTRVSEHDSSERGSVHWTLRKNETAYAQKLVAAIARTTGVTPKLEEREGTIQVHLYSKQWAHVLAEFGQKASKHLPEQYLCANPEYLQGLFDGLFDSDGHEEAGGRPVFTNTSTQLIELFGLLCKLLYGSFPNYQQHSAGGVNGSGDLAIVDADNVNPAYRARLSLSHEKRLTDDHQIIKALKLKHAPVKRTVRVYDIEVDCPTHSFIANNVIVHNSACTTRLVAGAGYPQFSALLESAHAARDLGIPIIADGGIRAGSSSHPGGADLSKAIGAGAATVILGSALAGTHEAPGDVEERDGRKVKTYRGMASMDAFISKQMEEGKPDEAAVDYVPEGITAVIPYRDEPAAAVVAKLVGGLRSGMAYSNARTVNEFQERVRFVQQTQAGMGESRPHALEHGSR